MMLGCRFVKEVYPNLQDFLAEQPFFDTLCLSSWEKLKALSALEPSFPNIGSLFISLFTIN